MSAARTDDDAVVGCPDFVGKGERVPDRRRFPKDFSVGGDADDRREHQLADGKRSIVVQHIFKPRAMLVVTIRLFAVRKDENVDIRKENRFPPSVPKGQLNR